MTSLSIFPVETQALEIPVVNIDYTPKYIVFKSGAFFSSTYAISQQANNTSQTVLLNIPNQGIFNSRKMQIRQPVTITLACTNTGAANIFQTNYMGLRAYPISAIVQNLQLQLNNASTDVALNEILPIIRHFNNPELQNFSDYSLSPSANDISSEYISVNGLAGSPFSAWGSQGIVNYSRSGYGIDTNVAAYSNTTTGATLGYTLTEPLNLLSPLIDEHQQDTGLYNVESAQIIVTYATNLSRIWSGSVPPNMTNFTVTVSLGACTILYDTINPSILTKLPPVAMYPYTKYNVIQTSVPASIAPNASYQIVGNTVTLNSVPESVYICVKKPVNTTTWLDTDSFLAITNVNVTCDANNNILANTSPQGLYQINVKNGYIHSYDYFSKNPILNATTGVTFGALGAPLKLNFQEDIIFADSALVSNGLTGKITFAANVTVTNQSQVTTFSAGQLSLFYVFVYSGICTIYNGQCNFNTGVLTKDDVLNAMNNQALKYNAVVHYQGRGFSLSNVWNKLRELGNKIKSSEFYQKVAPTIKEALGPYGQVASQLGFGKKKKYHRHK